MGRASFVGVTRVMTLSLAACGGSMRATTGPGGSNSSSGAGGADAAPAFLDDWDGSYPDIAMGPCNEVPTPTGGAQVRFVDGPPPGQMGGSIRDGLYELDSALVYVAGIDGGVSIEGRSHAIFISGMEWASASYFDNSPTTRYNDEATVSGATVSLSRVCGDPGSGILFGAQGTYSASDSALVLSFPAGAAFGNGIAILTFHRTQAGDAGTSTCVGTPCSNSYACCPGDAGAPPLGIACGASGTCEACNTNGLNDPCLGGSPQGNDCCPGLRCVNNRCVL
jgi:hypothetical protein